MLPTERPVFTEYLTWGTQPSSGAGAAAGRLAWGWVAALLACMLSLSRLFADDWQDGTLESLSAVCPALAAYPHGETGRDWLPQRLAEAAEVWVTEDSVSMIYEALSSGARVGLLPVPSLKKAGRVARGIARLVEEGFVTRFTDWSPAAGLAAPPRVLREADRCANSVAPSTIWATRAFRLCALVSQHCNWTSPSPCAAMCPVSS